jgi:hypothetical protein
MVGEALPFLDGVSGLAEDSCGVSSSAGGGVVGRVEAISCIGRSQEDG